MNLTISGHHLEVTPALRSYVTGKLDRITRHFDQVVDVKVLLTVEKHKEKEKRQMNSYQVTLLAWQTSCLKNLMGRRLRWLQFKQTS